jgi:hypothetical protein
MGLANDWRGVVELCKSSWGTSLRETAMTAGARLIHGFRHCGRRDESEIAVDLEVGVSEGIEGAVEEEILKFSYCT